MISVVRAELEESRSRFKSYQILPSKETREMALEAYKRLSKIIQSTDIDLSLEVAEIIKELENEA